MTINSYWQIDAAAEPQRLESSRRPVLPDLVHDRRGRAQNRFDYYTQLAEAAAQAGFDGVYIPYRRDADESRIIAAVVARAVPKIALIPEFPTSVGSAVYAAKQASTFQRATRGRLGWAIAPSADARTRAAEGDAIAEEQLGERRDEFLTVARGVYTTRPFTFAGRHFEVQDGGFEAPLTREPFPTVFLQGEHAADLAISAAHADVHLFAAAAPEALSRQIAALDAEAGRTGRSVAHGLFQPVVAREDSEAAVRDAARSAAPKDALVGAYDEVAARLAERAALGISHFVLSGSPSLEEAYRVGQHLLPRLHALTGGLRAAA
jgi:alkanesulfonate monooxygenase